MTSGRPDTVGAGARVLLRIARAPGARQATIGQLIGLPTRRYLPVLFETGLAWRQQGGGARYSDAVLGRLTTSSAAGLQDPESGLVLPWSPRLAPGMHAMLGVVCGAPGRRRGGGHGRDAGGAL